MTERSVVHATFTLERQFRSSPPRVFAAWSDRESKARWFAGNDPGYRLDFRPGGSERTSSSHAGKQITWEALYQEIVPNERIVYSAVLYVGDAVATVSQATVEFKERHGGTTLVLTEQGAYLDGREQPQWREEGTADWLNALYRHLDDHADATSEVRAEESGRSTDEGVAGES